MPTAVFVPHLILSLYRALPKWIRKARAGSVAAGYLDLAFLMLLFLHFAGLQ